MLHPSLLLLADGRLPTGGHAHSAGVESAVAHGDVHDIATAARFARGRLATSGVTDAAFAASATAWDGDATALGTLVAELEARIASPRAREVGRRLGRQLSRTARAIWPDRRWEGIDAVPDGVPQPIVLGVATAVAGGAPADAAVLAVHHLVGAIASASIRLLGLDPVAVAALQARLVDEASWVAVEAGRWAATGPADLPALTSTVSDVLAEAHGHREMRLFVA